VVVYISALPQDCTHYQGPFSFACLTSIWQEAGCLPVAHLLFNATDSELVVINRLNIR